MGIDSVKNVQKALPMLSEAVTLLKFMVQPSSKPGSLEDHLIISSGVQQRRVKESRTSIPDVIEIYGLNAHRSLHLYSFPEICCDDK